MTPGAQLETAAVGTQVVPRSSRFRWGIVALLTAISFVSYLERMNISVAAKFMMAEFSLSQIQMGRVFSSFLLGYALFQIPAGMLGDWFGPRRVFAVAATVWGVTTLLTGMVGVGFLGVGISALSLLLVVRFLLGVAEAPTYPVAARTIANWSPTHEHALFFAILIGGLSLGSAVTPPLISAVMVSLGWRTSFYISSMFAFLIALLWYYYSTDYPNQNSRVNAGELAIIHPEASESCRSPRTQSFPWRALFTNRDLLLVSFSYFLMGYGVYMFVFWMYTYLVDVRGFSLVSGGLATSMPFIAGTILTPAGGAFCKWLSRRKGDNYGRRWTVIGCLGIAALWLIAGATVENALLAVIALSLGYGIMEGAEGPFWASAVALGGTNAGAATGVMNTAGNLGGVVCTSLVPVLAAYFGWTFAIGSAACALGVGALLWLFVTGMAKSVIQH